MHVRAHFEWWIVEKLIFYIIICMRMSVCSVIVCDFLITYKHTRATKQKHKMRLFRVKLKPFAHSVGLVLFYFFFRSPPTNVSIRPLNQMTMNAIDCLTE